MAQNNSKPKASGGAVPVSLNLQKAVVWLLAGTTAISVLSLIITYGFYTDGFSVGYTVQMIGLQVVPIVAFIIAFLTLPRYPHPINRWFVAILKALVVMFFVSLLQAAKNAIGIYFVRQDGISMPPEWVTSPVGDYLIMGFSLAAFIFVTLQSKMTR